LDELQNYYNEIKNYDAVILAVSVESAQTNIEIKDKFGLEYPMLCDVEHKVVKKYGVLETKDDVRPSMFIIDKDGTVRWRYIEQNGKYIANGDIIVEKLEMLSQ